MGLEVRKHDKIFQNVETGNVSKLFRLTFRSILELVGLDCRYLQTVKQLISYHPHPFFLCGAFSEVINM